MLVLTSRWISPAAGKGAYPSYLGRAANAIASISSEVDRNQRDQGHHPPIGEGHGPPSMIMLFIGVTASTTWAFGTDGGEASVNEARAISLHGGRSQTSAGLG